MSLESISEKSPKHCSILSSITRLRAVRMQVEDLSNRIAGIKEEEETSQEISKPVQTLLSVLDNAGDYIAEEAELICKLTQKIHEQLF